MSVDRARMVSAFDAWDQAPAALRRLRAQLDTRGAQAVVRAEAALAAELRRRLGPAPAVGEIVAAYGEAEVWARDVVADALAPRSLPEALAPLIDGAFARIALAVRTRGAAAGGPDGEMG